MNELGASVSRKNNSQHGATVSELVREYPGAVIHGDATVRVCDVRHDSREVRPGELFVARKGRGADGVSFVPDAIARGAVAIACDRLIDHLPGHLPGHHPGVVQITVPDANRAMAYFADLVWGHPSWSTDIAGITGTNGKTTTAWLLERVLTDSGISTGLIGTVAHRFKDTTWPALHTTPESDDLARRLAAMHDQGASAVVMEVSSHALSLQRVEAVRFRAAGFTNLTQDHLDFHGTLENYISAKRRLFTELSPAFCVLNIDDPVGVRFARELAHPVTFSSRGANANTNATLRLVRGGAHASGIDAEVDTPEGAISLHSPLRGAHNVENLLLVLGMAGAMGVTYARAAEVLAYTDGVPGRLERVVSTLGDPGFDVLVDYAHTPDALARVLATLRVSTPRSIVCVFGCGGDRDRTKRALMGEAVARGADRVILTSDNPRSEDPSQIARDATVGLETLGVRFEIELDRRVAIRRAIELAQPGDVVLIAGKGHETYQEINGVRSAFDDRTEARAALDTRLSRGR